MPNVQAALALCEAAIRKDLGRIDDLPPEVANTIANVYYRHWHAVLNFAARRGRYAEADGDVLQRLASVAGAIAEDKADLMAIPKMVACLRELDPAHQPNLYRMAVNYFLDVFKYRIPNAHRKIGLWLMIERRFRKVDEIAGLGSVLVLREQAARMEENRREAVEAIRREVQAGNEEQQRQDRLLAQMPEDLRKLYYWKSLVTWNELRSPEEFVNFHVEIGQILEEEKPVMLKEVAEAWDKFMALPNL